MALLIAVSVTGTATENDVRGAEFGAKLENAWRASQTPPLAVLPTSTAAELKAAHQAYLGRMALASHNSCIDESSEEALREEFKAAFQSATDAQRAAALAALTT